MGVSRVQASVITGRSWVSHNTSRWSDIFSFWCSSLPARFFFQSRMHSSRPRNFSVQGVFIKVSGDHEVDLEVDGLSGVSKSTAGILSCPNGEFRLAIGGKYHLGLLGGNCLTIFQTRQGTNRRVQQERCSLGYGKYGWIQKQWRLLVSVFYAPSSRPCPPAPGRRLVDSLRFSLAGGCSSSEWVTTRAFHIMKANAIVFAISKKRTTRL